MGPRDRLQVKFLRKKGVGVMNVIGESPERSR